MQIRAENRRLEGPTAIAIGIFDGVHLGHQALLRKAVALAERHGVHSVAYSFHPHPAKVMAPDLAPKLTEPTEARLERFAQMGIHTALIERFDRELAAVEAEAFVRDNLVAKLRAQHVVVGSNFNFGHKKRGDVALLQQLGPKMGFETHPIEAVKVQGIHVSSTKIREFVTAGRMRGAAMLLGRPFELRGLVTRGEGRGAQIGVPTANVSPENELLPGMGVFVAWLSAGPGMERLPAVVNVGFTPTFGSLALKIEAHILDFESRPLYGTAVGLEFLVKLRDEVRFDGVEALKEQIAKDIAKAREVIAAVAATGNAPQP